MFADIKHVRQFSQVVGSAAARAQGFRSEKPQQHQARRGQIAVPLTAGDTHTHTHTRPLSFSLKP